MDEQVTVWVTKYTLSTGEVERLVCQRSSTGGQYLYPINAETGLQLWYRQFKLGRDAHLTRDAAIVAVEAMRRKKIDSLRKQIDKLSKLQFKVDE